MKKIDIDNPYWYEYAQPEKKQRTRDRLSKIVEMGMTENGNASFGIEGLMSGLYIERIWSWTDEEFEGYLDWVRSLIA